MARVSRVLSKLYFGGWSEDDVNSFGNRLAYAGGSCSHDTLWYVPGCLHQPMAGLRYTGRIAQRQLGLAVVSPMHREVLDLLKIQERSHAVYVTRDSIVLRLPNLPVHSSNTSFLGPFSCLGLRKLERDYGRTGCLLLPWSASVWRAFRVQTTPLLNCTASSRS
jgi:hypothetical protein